MHLVQLSIHIKLNAVYDIDLRSPVFSVFPQLFIVSDHTTINTPKMSLPTSQKKWVIRGTQKGIDEYDVTEGPIPSVNEHGVPVEPPAPAIDYRYLIIPTVRWFHDFSQLRVLYFIIPTSFLGLPADDEDETGRLCLCAKPPRCWWLRWCW